MPDKTPRKPTPDEELDLQEELLAPNAVVSSTECTGMVPSMLRSEEQGESYEEIYIVPRPKSTKDEKKPAVQARKSPPDPR